VFKLFPQRVFVTLYPMLKDTSSAECKPFALQVIMILCSIVNQTFLEDKLKDIIPLAEQSLFIEAVSVPQIKVIALNILKKAINAEGDWSYLDSLIGYIFKSIQSGDSSLQLLIECLDLLTKVSKFSKSIVRKYKDQVVKEAGRLLDHKKRPVRRSARVCINEWQIMFN